MEQVVVGISLNTLFKPKLEKVETLTNQKDAIFLYHQEKSVYDKGPLFSFIEQLLQCKKQNLLSFVEVVLISDVSPTVSPCIIESLVYYGLEIDQIILSNQVAMIDYLKVLNVDLYFSADLELVREVQKLNIMTGFISLKRLGTDDCKIGIDHRLFSKEKMGDIIGKMIPVFGVFQKLLTNFKVSLLTTRSYSVESWVKDLFKLSQCKINEVCFLGIGSTEDVSSLFDLIAYIEGGECEAMIGFPPPNCILNIDF